MLKLYTDEQLDRMLEQEWFDKGYAEGKAEGIEEGMAKGIEEGVAKGKAEEKHSTIARMHNMGMDISVIAAVEDCTPDEVEKIIAEIGK